MKQYSTNEAFFKLFKEQNCTQVEMGHRIELDKHSVHDWLRHRNELKFSNLERAANLIGKKIIIKIEDL
jgi:hypothetical protein